MDDDAGRSASASGASPERSGDAPAGPAPGAPPPADGAGPPRSTARWTRRRWLAAGTAALTAAIAVVAIARRPHGRPAVATRDAPAAAGPALRAPQAPGLAAPVPGAARLTGVVVDGAGLPVAGAEVSAEPERGAADRAAAAAPAPGPPPGDAGIADAGAAGPTVTLAPATGGDGRFVLDGLAPGRFRVRVTGAGLVPAELRYAPVPSDETRIVVARQVAVEGTVTDGGAPVANAPVGLRGDAIGGTIEARTGATGAFRFANLPEGRYQLFAWQGALAARTVRVARLGAGPFGPVELRLEAAAIVVGRVVDRDEGTGLAAAIELRPSGDDQAPRYARSGDDGVFRIEGVPSGRWIAEAFVPGYLGPGGVELEAGHGIPELALARGAAIAGRVLDADGHPVAGASVRALVDPTGGAAPRSAGGAVGGPTPRDRASPIVGASPGELSAEVERDRLRRFSGRTAAPVPAARPGALDADPQFIARGELGVLVGPIPPIPPPGARVAQLAIAVDPSLAGEPAPLAVDPARASIWTTGPDGAYRIRGLAAGKVSVLAAAAGFAEVRGRPVAIQRGQLITGVDLVLTPGTWITGKVSDQHGAPVVGAEVTATPAGGAAAVAGGSATVFTGDDGAYRLGPMTGALELRATAYGHGEARRALELPFVRGQAPAERREDLVLVVADAAFAGLLEDTTGAPVGGAHIDVVGGASDGRHAIAHGDGTFSIDRLPAGPLRLHIEHPAYPPRDVDAVAGGAEQARARLRLPLGGGVEGALLDAASGAAIPGVTLAAAGPDNALAEAATDRLGRWKLAPLAPGRWRITSKLPGYLTAVRELDVPVAHAPGATSLRDIRIELLRGALIGGTVRDARGQRIAAAHVIASAAGGAGSTCDGDSDGRGEFRLNDCPTGDLVVTASKADARGAVRATVRAGDEVLSLALELR